MGDDLCRDDMLLEQMIHDSLAGHADDDEGIAARLDILNPG